MLPLLLLLAAPCDADRASTVRWLEELASQVDRGGPLVSPDLTLVERQGAALPEAVASVVLDVRGANVSGVAAPDLKKALAENFDRYRMLHGKEAATPVVLLVAQAVPWKEVAAAAAVLRDSGAQVTLGFKDQLVAAAPGPSSIDAELEKVKANPDPVQKSDLLAKLSPQVFGTCPALAAALQRPPGEYDVAPVLHRFAAALPKCECKVDLPAFKKMTWLTLVPKPLLSGVPLTLSAKGTVVKLQGATPWSSAWEKVLAASAGNKPVQLEATR